MCKKEPSFYGKNMQVCAGPSPNLSAIVIVGSIFHLLSANGRFRRRAEEVEACRESGLDGQSGVSHCMSLLPMDVTQR
jgi:hypothetical protein